MTAKPSPPDHLLPGACVAFTRIVDQLWRRGEWLPGYDIMAELAASSCALYTAIVCDDQASAVLTKDEIEQYRTEARNALASMKYFTSERARLGLVDANGHDRDLIEICRLLGD